MTFESASFLSLSHQGAFCDWLPRARKSALATDDPIRDGLASLSRFFIGDSSMGETLQRVVELAAVAVPPASYTGITMLVDDKVATSIFSDPEVPEIDQAQYTAGSGPCLDAFREGVVHRIPSTEREDRWPKFCRSALQHGIHSTLSLPLLVGNKSVGALNLYSKQEDGFSADDEANAESFALQSAVVLANAQAYWDARTMSEGLTEAMRSRATIEQAKGILMAQSNIPPDSAFDMLVRASQRENRKLRDVAQGLVDRHSGQDTP
jgi:GAF domain-containing protein